jgi:hypothetical protein
MRFDYVEGMTRLWVDNFWDDSLSAEENLRRFREWWKTMYDDAAPVPETIFNEMRRGR